MHEKVKVKINIKVDICVLKINRVANVVLPEKIFYAAFILHLWTPIYL